MARDPFAATVPNLEALNAIDVTQQQTPAEMQKIVNELKEQLDKKDEEIQKQKRKTMHLEYALVEAQTVVAIGVRSAKDFDSRMRTKDEEHAKQIGEMSERSKKMLERLQHAPKLEQTLLGLYQEVRYHIQGNLCGPEYSDSDREDVEKWSSVVLVDQLRLWVRKLMQHSEQTQQLASLYQQTQANIAASLEGGAGGGRRQRGLSMKGGNVMKLPNNTTTSQGVEQTMTGISGDAANNSKIVSFVAAGGSTNAEQGNAVLNTTTPSIMQTANSSTHHSGSSPQKTRSASISEADVSKFASNQPTLAKAISDAIRERDEARDELDELRSMLESERKEATEVFKQLRIQTDLARRDSARAKLENKNKEKLIAQLQAQMQGRAEAAASYQQIQKAQNEVVEIKKNMKIALQAKKQEMETVKRIHQDELSSALSQVEHLRKDKLEAKKLRSELQTAQEHAKSATMQLVRADVKGLQAENDRNQQLVKKQSEHIRELEEKITNKGTLLKYFEASNARMTDEYNAIFQAHLREHQKNELLRISKRDGRIAKQIKGPNSSLNVEYYRSRYDEVLQDLSKAQGKMKHLILLAHHEQLSHSKHQEALKGKILELLEDKEKSERDSEFHEQVSNLTQSYVGKMSEGVQNTTSLEEHEKNLEPKSHTNSSPSIRIFKDGHSEMDVSIPIMGSDTDFGNPLGFDGVVRVRTHIPAKIENEVSWRALEMLQTGEALPPAKSHHHHAYGVSSEHSSLNVSPVREARVMTPAANIGEQDSNDEAVSSSSPYLQKTASTLRSRNASVPSDSSVLNSSILEHHRGGKKLPVARNGLGGFDFKMLGQARMTSHFNTVLSGERRRPASAFALKGTGV